MIKLLLSGLWVAAAFAQTWRPQTSTTTESLRGISAVNKNVAWASGAKGTILKTTDGGKTWQKSGMTGVGDLDFRDIEAVSAQTVYSMSAGPGQLSRVYKTTNGGTSWQLQSTNNDPNGFWDCMSFWNSRRGIIVGDPVDGHFTILTTEDGSTWRSRAGPQSNKDEAMFAASGTCVITRGTREAWFATGGQGGARLFHSTDAGETWTVTSTPVRHDAQSSGIFSIAFADPRQSITVGGDYSKPTEASEALAISNDGGKSWATASGLSGFRSAVIYSKKRKLWIATGTSGTDVSSDGGKSWKNVGAGFNAISFSADGAGWGVGAKGSIALLE